MTLSLFVTDTDLAEIVAGFLGTLSLAGLLLPGLLRRRP